MDDIIFIDYIYKLIKQNEFDRAMKILRKEALSPLTLLLDEKIRHIYHYRTFIETSNANTSQYNEMRNSHRITESKVHM